MADYQACQTHPTLGDIFNLNTVSTCQFVCTDRWLWCAGDGFIGLEEFRYDCVSRQAVAKLQDLDQAFTRQAENGGVTRTRYQQLFAQVGRNFGYKRRTAFIQLALFTAFMKFSSDKRNFANPYSTVPRGHRPARGRMSPLRPAAARKIRHSALISNTACFPD